MQEEVYCKSEGESSQRHLDKVRLNTGNRWDQTMRGKRVKGW